MSKPKEEPKQCCERDHNHDGNCDKHPEEIIKKSAAPLKPIEAPEVLNLDKIIEIDKIKDNSIMLLRFSEFSERVRFTVMAIAQRYGKEIQAKNVSVLLLGPNDSLEVVPEEELNKIGWSKKSKLITNVPSNLKVR